MPVVTQSLIENSQVVNSVDGQLIVVPFIVRDANSGPVRELELV